MLARIKEFWRHNVSLIVLIAVLAAVGGTWAFIAIADEVREGGTQKFDDWAIRSLRRANDPATPIGPAWLGEVGRDLTALGGVTVLALVTFAVAGYLLMAKKFHAMWLVFIATFTGLLLSSLLKHSFHRERPDLVPHLSMVY